MGTRLTSFRNKFIGLTLAVVIGSQIATVLAVLFAASEDANKQAFSQMESGIELFRSIIDSRAKILDQTVRPLASDSELAVPATTRRASNDGSANCRSNNPEIAAKQSAGMSH